MDEIYRQNAHIVYHFLYSMCKDETLAEDLMQETFLRAFESLERYDGSCKFSTWLCQIAKHLLYQHWSKNKHYIPVPIDDEMKSDSDTEQQAMEHVELLAVWDEIHKLPELMQKVVYLRVMSDLSFKEIGTMLGKSENWARVNFYRAKIILMKEVRNE